MARGATDSSAIRHRQVVARGVKLRLRLVDMRSCTTRSWIAGTVALATILTAGCGSRQPPGAPLRGKGATFPAPLIDVWAHKFGALTGTSISYYALGSTKGIEALIAGKADFAATESPMTAEQMAQAGGEVLHLPITMSAVALAYNAPGVPDGLRLTPDVVADLFLGEVKRWDDPRIAWLNPGVTLPPKPITVIHRRDGSGTTRILTEWLSHVSPRWRERIGAGTKVAFPVGLSADGSEGVSEFVWRVPGTLGYVSLTYARAKRLATASIGTANGRFLAPSLDSITAAGASATAMLPEDMRVALLAASSPDAYPIVGFSFLVVRRDMEDADKAASLTRFVRWALHDGQSYGPMLSFATLPPEVVKRADDLLRTMRAGGQQVAG